MERTVQPALAAFRGRLVNTMGDGFLVEFASVVDAVQCATAIQTSVTVDQSGEVADRKMLLRIGVHPGEVIVEGSDIHGDGVNIAARLEGLAEPGGICISGPAYDYVAGKIDAGFVDLGPQSVKNIAQPVRVLRLRPPDTSDGSRIADVSSPVPGFEGRPAIAVLAFDNLSGDQDQEYFIDGIAEDILTRLAMWRWCPVIARNSSFAFKGKAADIRRVGQELGARYVLEGSVRRTEHRVRIVSQLIDAETGHHVWADRYDRGLDDIFAVQDEIVDKITGALAPAVGQAETKRASTKTPANLDAWESYHGGIWHWSRATREDLTAARDFLTRAIELDPGFALPHSVLAIVATFEVLFSVSPNPSNSFQEALREARLATDLDPMDPLAHVGLCQASVFVARHDEAIAAGRTAVELNPSLAIAHHVLGVALFFDGQGAEAAESILRGIRLSPRDVLLPYQFMGLGVAYLTARNYEAAVEATGTSVGMLTRNPLSLRFHAAALAHSGHPKEAREAFQRAATLTSELSKEQLRQATPHRNDSDFDH
jgi:adenylate cyclase